MAKSDAFDRLTELAAAVFDAPTALISVVEEDRQWFRSHRGHDGTETTRQESFCARLVDSPPESVLVVEDATRDDRFRDMRAVTEDGLRFYAGAVVTTADGQRDGVVCVVDTKARPAPTPAQMESLKLLARLAGQEIDQIRLTRRQAELRAMLEMAEAMAGLGHWRYDIPSGDIWWSDEVYRIHGFEPGSIEPRAHSASAQYHPDDRAEVWRRIEHALATGEGYDTELRLTVDGEEKVTRTRARVELGDDGRPSALFGVLQDITETVRANERIARSEALFRLISETSTDVIVRLDTKGRFLYVSPSARTVLGRDPQSLLGQHCTEIVLDEDWTRIRAILTEYVKAGPGATPPRYEYRSIRPDGREVWLDASPRAIWSEDGRVVEFQDCIRDITARKAAEREQAELVETLKLAEDLAGLGSWKLDALTGEVRWSDEVYRIHGVDPETYDPNLDDAVQFYHPDDRQAVRDWCARAIETGESGEFRLRLIRADGEERVVASQCRPERRDGRTTALFGVFQDVTERVRAEDRVRASEARYRLLADNATDVIATYGLDGVFQYLSPAIEGPMGYRPEEMIGRPFSDFVLPDDVRRVRAAFMAYARGPADATPPRIAYRAVRKDGAVVWLEAHPKLIRDAQGRAVEFQDVVRDVTAAKAMEDELIAARDAAEAATRAKSDFLANMSHELRTPLTSVIGFSGLLRNSQALPDQERRFADRIATASEALLGVINDILDYSKLVVGAVDLDPRAFDPAELAASAAALVERQCEEKGLALAVDVEPEAGLRLMGDDGRLRQVLLNLLSNAVKFTASGEIRLETRWSDGRLRAAVTDSGIGIAADKLDSLFERFTQADASTTRTYGGTGLGLAISRRLIEMMGGEIGATSRPGEGSTFWFEVPLPVAEAGEAHAAGAAPDLPKGLRVLMADDAPANRELVKVILAQWGVDLETVENGAEAAQAAARGKYDLILMDVHMPVMDGMDAARSIRALPGRAGRVPILALTANVQPEQVEACRTAGMDGHVGKPIQVAELISAMAAAARRRRARAPDEQIA